MKQGKTNRFCQENALVIAKTLFQQHKRRLYTWISPDGRHRNQIDYILCSQRWRSSMQSSKTRPGADCGSDHELLIAKFRLKLKKVGKTTRPFNSVQSLSHVRLFATPWITGVDHLMMSMCRVFSCVVGRGFLLWPVHFLGKTLLVFALLHSTFQGQICLLLQVFLGFLLLHSSRL